MGAAPYFNTVNEVRRTKSIYISMFFFFSPRYNLLILVSIPVDFEIVFFMYYGPTCLIYYPLELIKALDLFTHTKLFS